MSFARRFKGTLLAVAAILGLHGLSFVVARVDWSNLLGSGGDAMDAGGGVWILGLAFALFYPLWLFIYYAAKALILISPMFLPFAMVLDILRERFNKFYLVVPVIFFSLICYQFYQLIPRY